MQDDGKNGENSSAQPSIDNSAPANAMDTSVPSVPSSSILHPSSFSFRAVFLDRDGVINRSVVRDGLPYPPDNVEEFDIYEDVPAGCTRLRQAGFLLVVATNQPDVGRGTQTQSQVEAIHASMCAALPEIDRVEVCYDPGGHLATTNRRKPAPGMLLDAADALGISLAHSFMIGDRWRDVDCGHAAGCRTVFIDREYHESLRQAPDWTVQSFTQAVEVILAAVAAGDFPRKSDTGGQPGSVLHSPA